jgi:cell division protease FtsH
MPEPNRTPPRPPVKRKVNRTLRRYPWLFSLIYIAIAIVLALVPYFFQSGHPRVISKVVPYSEFLSQLKAGHLNKVEVTPTQLIGESIPKQKNQPTDIYTTTRLPGIDDTSLLQEFEKQHLTIIGHFTNGNSIWPDLILWLPFVFLIGLSFYGAWRTKKAAGPLQIGKNRAKIYDRSQQMATTFADVAGIDEAKAELQEIVDFLIHPERYRRLGGRIPRGVLLIGPPGTGKTLLARAVAGEAQTPFFFISGSEFVEMFVGVGAARVRDMFEEAKKKAPCIVYIDELDAIGKSRSSGRGMFAGGHDEHEQTLNQLLVEMDGFNTNENVIIMAATNTPDVLDAALLRPGRFDRQVVVDRPDLRGRLAILQVHAKKIRLGPAVDLRTIAARTPGMVGADLANVINEGALLAARRGADFVEESDLEAAIDRVMLGLEKKGRIMTEDEKERVAYHETGHALVALSLPNTDPVHRVSIIPRTLGALGHTLQLPLEERYLATKPQLEDQLRVLLGGRAAEDIIFNGIISTGASDDLQRSTELARQMVTRFGMSERMGNITYGRPLESRFLKGVGAEERNYSETTAEAIDQEIRRMVDGSYDQVKGIISSHRQLMDRIVNELMHKETLEEKDLKALLAGTELEAGVGETMEPSPA